MAQDSVELQWLLWFVAAGLVGEMARVTNIWQLLSNSARWFSAHPRASLAIVLTLFFASRFAFDVWSIYDSIPDLPNGPLQIVGVSADGARFVELNGDAAFEAGVNRIIVLVAFDKPMTAKEGAFRFEAKRELVDCSKRQIELEGAGFYDDQGNQTLSRVFDRKPKQFEPIDTETTLVCDHQDFGQPKVVGFRAALVQTQATISRANSGQWIGVSGQFRGQHAQMTV
jgi:hypothetical protein